MGVGVAIGRTDVVFFTEVGARDVGCIPMFVCGGDSGGGVAVIVIGSHVDIDVNVVSCVSAAIQDSDWVFLLICVVGVGDVGIGVEVVVVCWGAVVAITNFERVGVFGVSLFLFVGDFTPGAGVPF